MKAEMWNFSEWIEGCEADYLNDIFYKMLVGAGFAVVDMVDKHFIPQGYTMLYLLAESHFAIHTFPEAGKTYVELSSCVKEYQGAFVEAFNNHDGIIVAK